MQEGSTTLIAPDTSSKGPGAKQPGEPFYNPAMRVNRDLSLLLVDAYARRRGRAIDVADVLAGTGARSLRLAHELDVDVTVHANDADPRAAAAMEAGRSANGIDPDRLRLHHDEAHRFLASRRFDVIDIDPFGAPTPFLDAAVHATRHQGLLCLTATDTGALCGTYPRVCRRRYGAEHGLRAAPWKAEVGLRILAGTAIRAAGRFDRAATPVLSVVGGHWMRVVLRIEDGKQAGDHAAQALSGVAMDEARLAHFETPGQAGPLWSGALHDEGFLASWQELPGICDETRSLVALLAAEAAAPAFWADPGALRRVMDHDAPRRRVLCERLHDAGWAAAPTHIDPQGIRTDADLDALRGLW